MLTTLDIKRFTLFREQNLTFSPGLNVIVGENSSGKSHLLKLIYTLISTSSETGLKPNAGDPTKTVLQKAYGEKLYNVFRPEKGIGRLVARKQGRERCEISAVFSNTNLNTRISFATNSKTDVQVDELPQAWEDKTPLYLPTRELMTVYPNFVSVYERHYLEFEETWRDTCLLLGALLRKDTLSEATTKIISPIENILGGSVVLENGRFYLNTPGFGNVEMPLIAEGHRKLAMLVRLIANGVIQPQSYLFWDEPEANLNPKLIKILASAIFQLAQYGVQVFLATHSLFLLRELEIIISQNAALPFLGWRFFGIESTDGSSIVHQSEKVNEIGNITSLEESLAQSDRYMEL